MDMTVPEIEIIRKPVVEVTARRPREFSRRRAAALSEKLNPTNTNYINEDSQDNDLENILNVNRHLEDDNFIIYAPKTVKHKSKAKDNEQFKTVIENAVLGNMKVLKELSRASQNNDNKLGNNKKKLLHDDFDLNSSEVKSTIDILKKQNILLHKVLQKVYSLVKRSNPNAEEFPESDEDFDQIITVVEGKIKRDIYNADPFNNTDTTSTTVSQDRYKLVVDETEVKNALQRDPLVKRVLGIYGKKKRDFIDRVRLEEKLRE